MILKSSHHGLSNERWNIDIFWKTVDFGLFKTISEFQNLLCFDLGNCNLTLSKGSFDYFHTGTKSWHVIVYLPRSLFWIEYMKVILIDVSIPRNKLETSEKLKGFQGWFNNKNLTIAWKREEIHFFTYERFYIHPIIPLLLWMTTKSLKPSHWVNMYPSTFYLKSSCY